MLSKSSLEYMCLLDSNKSAYFMTTSRPNNERSDIAHVPKNNTAAVIHICKTPTYAHRLLLHS